MEEVAHATALKPNNFDVAMTHTIRDSISVIPAIKLASSWSINALSQKGASGGATKT